MSRESEEIVAMKTPVYKQVFCLFIKITKRKNRIKIKNQKNCKKGLQKLYLCGIV